MNDYIYFECDWCSCPLAVTIPPEYPQVVCSECHWTTAVPELPYPRGAETQDIKHHEWITRYKEIE